MSISANTRLIQQNSESVPPSKFKPSTFKNKSTSNFSCTPVSPEKKPMGLIGKITVGNKYSLFYNLWTQKN